MVDTTVAQSIEKEQMIICVFNFRYMAQQALYD